MLFGKSAPKIRFLCATEDEGVIAPPVPATRLPAGLVPQAARRSTRAWRRKSDTGLTVKRCMPFLDAMTTGWILPLAATVRLEIQRRRRTTVEAGWDFDRTMVSNHGLHQVARQPAGAAAPAAASSTTTGRS